jgi:phage tail sheath protein FI
VESVFDTTFSVDDQIHGELNDELVNAIRMIPGRGAVLLGARTLERDFRWRYVNVRRLLCMIEESIDEAMQWTVFEPHDLRLRRQIDRIVRQFLERLFRLGMLDGATSEEAYTVVCNSDNNEPADADAGRIICDIGLQPPYPAEFVVVRIGITRDAVEVEEKGAQDA